jgi:predicted secreted protein
MAENAGHLSIVESSTDAAAYTEVDGATMASRDLDRAMIDVTSMKDATNHKIKIAGLRDGQCAIEGHVVFASGTLQLDTGIKNIVQRARDGGLVAVRTKLDGAAGTYRTLASALVSALSISAEVDGAVKWSCTLQNNGAVWS